MSHKWEHSQKANPRQSHLSWFKPPPDVSAAHQSFAWSDVKLSSLAIPGFSEQSCSVCTPLQPLQPKPGQLLTWETNTHGYARLKLLLSHRGLRFLMSCRGNKTLAVAERGRQDAPLTWTWSRRKPYLCSLIISAADVGITGEPEVDGSVPWEKERGVPFQSPARISRACAQTESRFDGEEYLGQCSRSATTFSSQPPSLYWSHTIFFMSLT